MYKFYSVYIVFLTESCAVNLNNKPIDINELNRRSDIKLKPTDDYVNSSSIKAMRLVHIKVSYYWTINIFSCRMQRLSVF